ncbi:MAG: helix-turn-helix transcriptional regulator [Verrucomicrobia bacterium]|nr:helix-turn-helix transcriptional regulator [Verrucomicrobiota bacterium]
MPIIQNPSIRTLNFDSPVGGWSLSLWTPAPDLTHAVEQLWSVEAVARDFQEKVLPRRTVELIINLADSREPHELLNGSGKPVRYHRAWISGLQTGCLHLHSRTAPRLIAASLKPAYAGLMADANSGDLAGRVIEWDAPWLTALRERLLNTRTLAQRFALLEDSLRQRLAAARRCDTALAWAAEQLVATGGELRVTGLSEHVGLSRKQFIARFRRQVGLPPKLFARVLRFDRAINAVRALPEVVWTDLAHRCGYYDQAHFNRDFREFAGCTPGEFLAAREPSGQAMLVDER